MIDNQEIKKLMEDFMSSEIFIRQKELLEAKKKTLKTGNNVVHINYIGGIINDEDLENFSNNLKKVDLELSSYDKNGVVYASLEDYTNLMSIVLNPELTKNIVFGVLQNFVWDTIKIMTKTVFNRVKNENASRISNKSSKKETTFGLELSLNKNTGFKFRLDGKFSTEILDTALDQARDLVKAKTPNETYEHPTFHYYNDKKKSWITVDVLKELGKKVNKTSKKPSKKNRKANDSA